MRILETNMEDGIDLIHDWSNLAEAIDSGRFEYLDNFDPELLIELSKRNVSKLGEFIDAVGYPFSIID